MPGLRWCSCSRGWRSGAGGCGGGRELASLLRAFASRNPVAPIDSQRRLSTSATFEPAASRRWGAGLCLITRPGFTRRVRFLVTLPSVQCAARSALLADRRVLPLSLGTTQTTVSGCSLPPPPPPVLVPPPPSGQRRRQPGRLLPIGAREPAAFDAVTCTTRRCPMSSAVAR